METPISLGIIGVGNIVKTMHLPILYNLPGIKLAYLADPHLDVGVAKAFGAKPIKLSQEDNVSLPPTDLVFLATPPGVRASYIQTASSEGAFVFTEKPFATSIEEHNRILDSNTRVACNYNRRNFSNIRQLKKLLKSNLLGQLESVRIFESASPRGTGKGPGHYQFDRTLGGGGILTERGCHTLSQLDYIFDEEDFDLEGSSIQCIEGIDVDAFLSFSIGNDSSTRIPLQYILSTGRLGEPNSSYSFENGSIHFDHTNPDSKLTILDKRGVHFPLMPENKSVTTATQSFAASWIEVLDMVKQASPIDSKRTSSLRTSQWTENAYKLGGIL